MKPKFYTLLCALWLIGFCFSSNGASAQCNCGNGDPATPITYYYVLDTTTAPSATISFPKFIPSTGMLTCVVFEDTLSLVSLTEVKNNAATDVTYRFLLNLSNEFSGPGISVFESASKNYGPTLLAAKGNHPADSTSYGPDTLFQNSFHQTYASPSSHTDYLGVSGNVDFVYTVNGGLTSQSGGINFLQQINSKYWGSFRLTYYWCPQEILPDGMKYFNAYKKDGKINLEWLGLNENSDIKYEVEISTDGKNFQSIKTVQGTGSLSSLYNIAYSPETGINSNLFFRVKRIEPSKNYSYSPVKLVNVNEGNLALTTYPNPAISGVRLDFDRAIKGDMEVELINTTGQRIFTKQYTLRNQPSLQVDWSVKPAPGLYYVRATDKATRQQFTTRLLIQ